MQQTHEAIVNSMIVNNNEFQLSRLSVIYKINYSNYSNGKSFNFVIICSDCD